jgi:hypothetical protein
MNGLKQIQVRVSSAQADKIGNEEVTAAIRNDFAKDENGQTIYDKEFSYQMDDNSVLRLIQHIQHQKIQNR